MIDRSKFDPLTLRRLKVLLHATPVTLGILVRIRLRLALILTPVETLHLPVLFHALGAVQEFFRDLSRQIWVELHFHEGVRSPDEPSPGRLESLAPGVEIQQIVPVWDSRII
jgi:hypothetical protein